MIIIIIQYPLKSRLPTVNVNEFTTITATSLLNGLEGYKIASFGCFLELETDALGKFVSSVGLFQREI
jgi:hypothetical protein